MIHRTISDKIIKSASQVPAVTIIGPRQAGKTTLAKELFPFEIKSSMTPNKDFAKNLKLFCKNETNAEDMNVIYCGEAYDSYCDCRYLHYSDVAEIIRNGVTASEANIIKAE